MDLYLLLILLLLFLAVNVCECWTRFVIQACGICTVYEQGLLQDLNRVCYKKWKWFLLGFGVCSILLFLRGQVSDQ